MMAPNGYDTGGKLHFRVPRGCKENQITSRAKEVI